MTAPAVGQRASPRVDLVLSTRVLEIGEVVEAELVCRNFDRPGVPVLPLSKGFVIELIRDTPNRFQQFSIVNGRKSSEVKHTYPIRITARAPGKHTIDPIRVTEGGGGKVYQTTPIRIKVAANERDSRASGDKYIFVEVSVTPKSLYVSEFYTATLRIGIRQVEHNGRVLGVDLFKKVLDQRTSQFAIFPGGNGRTTTSKITLPDSTGARHTYEVLRVVKRIKAEKVGTVSVGPVFVKANYPTSFGRGFSRRIEFKRTRKETARAPAVIVVVKEPPLDNRPGDYGGAIGRYRMDVSATPTHVEQGQAVTLTMSIRGAPLDGVPGPLLSVQPELASRFDFMTDELVGEVRGRAKIFRRAVFPKQAGEQTIPPITWSYFDTRNERYVTLRSTPVSITVDPPRPTSSAIALENGDTPITVETTLTRLAGGLAPNYAGDDVFLAARELELSPPWIVALAAPPCAYLALSLVAIRRKRHLLDTGLARRRRAQRRANQRIAGALNETAPDERIQQLGGALTTYLTDRFGLPPGTLTPSEARTLLVNRGADATIADEITAFLEQCDAARYAAGLASDHAARDFAQQVRTWITLVERLGR